MSPKRNKTGSNIEITDRDVELFRKLNAAGWLTTHQILRYFFSGKSANAVSKRLRKLVDASYLAIARTGSTEQGLYRLAGKGRLALVEASSLDESEIRIPTQLPRKLEHFVAINDLRFYFEQLSDENARLLFFFSERELGLDSLSIQSFPDAIIAGLRAHTLVPDALASVRYTNNGVAEDVTIAIEYDAGTEHTVFFARTKVELYARLFSKMGKGLSNFRVLTFAPGLKRLIALMRQTVRHFPPRRLFYFALLEELTQREWQSAGIFLEPYDFFVPEQGSGGIEVRELATEGTCIPRYALFDLPAHSPRSLSLREERLTAVNP